tara:strand:- start:6113 stop:7054 length:942 start_codon:yes stop_codon:yes gene_type:complete
MNELTIRALLKGYGNELGLRIVAGQAGLDRIINNSDTHRPGMALTGFVDLFTVDQVQILGNTEMEYLRSLNPKKRRQALEIVYQFEVPCVLMTGRGRMVPELRVLAEEYSVPLLKSEFETAKFNHLLHFHLDDLFAPAANIHGTMVDVHGIGLLFKGRSAIGKSEVALDLVERGHRLVADDSVVLTRKSQGILVGTSPENLRDHMEIRGIGIMDVKKMFGVRGTRRQKRVEVVVQLVDWEDSVKYERVGIDDKTIVMLGIELPFVIVPLFPGKNITVIVEAIAMDYLLRIQGHNAASEFNRRLINSMNKADSK